MGFIEFGLLIVSIIAFIVVGIGELMGDLAMDSWNRTPIPTIVVWEEEEEDIFCGENSEQEVCWWVSNDTTGKPLLPVDLPTNQWRNHIVYPVETANALRGTSVG